MSHKRDEYLRSDGDFSGECRYIREGCGVNSA
jgi:hypothetical protein